MGPINGLQLVLVIYHCCWVGEMSAHQLIINGITFGEMWTYFPDMEYGVTNMEVDPYHPEHLIYTTECAIKVLDMRYFRSYLIAGNEEDCDYKEGVGREARFNVIYGFKTLNNTHIIIADRHNHCLRLVDRLSNSTSTYAGSCTNKARRNGLLLEARFDYPIDLLRKPNTSKFFVWEDSAIREIDTDEKQVSTFMHLDFSPMYLAIDGLMENIYISYGTGLAKINLDTKYVTDIISSFVDDFRDGSFEVARFSSVTQFILLNPDTIMAADFGNHRIRIVDMANSFVTSICNGEDTFSNDADVVDCQIPYPDPLVLIPDQSTILISSSLSIRGINVSGILQSNYSIVPSIPGPHASMPPETQPSHGKESETLLSHPHEHATRPPQPQPVQTAASTTLTVQCPVWVIAVSVAVSVIAVLAGGSCAIAIYKTRRCCKGCYHGENSRGKDVDVVMTVSKIEMSLRKGEESQDEQSVHDNVYTNDLADSGRYITSPADEMRPNPPC